MTSVIDFEGKTIIIMGNNNMSIKTAINKKTICSRRHISEYQFVNAPMKSLL